MWRRLRALGVAQLADSVVALPADARTREQLEWAAQTVIEAGGSAGVWLARPATTAQERELAESMTTARAAEYTALRERAEDAARGAAGRPEGATAGQRVLRRLRGELRTIGRRDFFPPPQREQARQAIEVLGAALRAPGSTTTEGVSR